MSKKTPDLFPSPVPGLSTGQMSNGHVSVSLVFPGKRLLCRRSLQVTLENEGGTSVVRKLLLERDRQTARLGKTVERKKGPSASCPRDQRLISLTPKIINRGEHFSRGHASWSFSFNNTKILNFSDPWIQIFSSFLQMLLSTRKQINKIQSKVFFSRFNFAPNSIFFIF